MTVNISASVIDSEIAACLAAGQWLRVEQLALALNNDVHMGVII